jgi:hypothetical protein
LVRRAAPRHVGFAGALLALTSVALRLAIAAHGDISRFVVAGAAFVDPAHRPAGDGPLHVFPSAGYDGQFFWRLAVDPTGWHVAADHGVTFDSAYRAPRIGYPVLAHLAAGGRADLVVWSLVGVNVVALGVLAYAGARLAARAGRSAIWGLAIAAAPGLVLALGRDLAECVTVAGLVGGIAALQARRPLVATAAWTLAVLSREQALLTVAAYACYRLASLATPHLSAAAVALHPWLPALAPDAADPGQTAEGPESPSVAGDQRREWADRSVRPEGGRWGVADLPWVGPLVAFAVWQGVLWHATGRLPLAAAGGTNLVPPFRDMIPGLVGWATGDLGRIHAVAPLQLAVAIALVVAAARVARTVPPPERFTVAALALATVAGTCLARSIWRDPSDLRHLVDVSVLSWVVLLAADRPVPRWAPWATALVWLATAAARIAAV